MASNDSEHIIRLNIPFDMNDEDERRFAELFESVPNGFKMHLCKKLLMESTPKSEDELDLMLAKLIRQRKTGTRGRGRAGRVARRGRGSDPRQTGDASPPAGFAAAGGDGAASDENALTAFGSLAGGTKW